jgi:hypothetical protein
LAFFILTPQKLGGEKRHPKFLKEEREKPEKNKTIFNIIIP